MSKNVFFIVATFVSKNMKVASIEKDNKRIIWLDFVKFIAISMMIAVHCTDNVTPTERSEAW